jgi:hypothetical protein
MKPNSCACYGSNDIHECYCNLKTNNMSKQTAMQILFDRNQEIIDKLEFTSNPMQVEYRKALVSVNDDICTELLAMEKEQIEDAWINGKDEGDIAKRSYIAGYTQCQEDMVNNFLSLIEEFKEKELPNRNMPYHYESEIASGLKYFEIFIKEKQAKI